MGSIIHETISEYYISFSQSRGFKTMGHDVTYSKDAAAGLEQLICEEVNFAGLMGGGQWALSSRLLRSRPTC